MILTAGNIVPGANSPTDSGQMLGLSTNRWNTVYATTFNGIATSAQYADLAENYLADAQYEPGTVLVLGGDEEVTVVGEKGSRRVVGVVTTNPAHLMNSALEGDNVVGIALQGRVPCKVLGRVQKGDLLVTAGREGYGAVLPGLLESVCGSRRRRSFCGLPGLARSSKQAQRAQPAVVRQVGGGWIGFRAV